MEFNFETPLILRLRKIAHSKTVLWCGILFAVYPILLGWGLISSLLSNPTLESLIQISSRFIFFILPCISFFIIYISARNKDTVLPTGGFTAAAILTLLAGIHIITLNLYYGAFGIAESFFINIFHSGGMPSRYVETDFFNLNIVYIVLTVVLVLFFFTLTAAFFSAASVSRNNKPRKFFPILLAIVSFIVFAFYLCYIAQYMINGGFEDFITMIVRVPQARVSYTLNFIMNFISPTAISFLCGCVGIGFAKASRRIK
ncbi:MAG: hypothetical protein IJP22_00185 [Clostridia bacterium]|nr:hypothetical protein [Clostridia bacterium]